MPGFTRYYNFDSLREIRFSKRKPCQSCSTGFTLIELLLYMGILVIVLVIMIGFLWNIILGSLKETSYQEVQQNARFALAKITQEAKKATGINSPPPGVSSNTLSLVMAATHLNPTIFDVVDGKLRITQGVSGPYELISDQVRVSNLQFTNLSYSDAPGTIRIEMEISHINPGARTEYEAQVYLKSSITLVAGGAAVPPPYIIQLRYRWRNDDGGE